jgi:hypothetical protein
MMMEIMVEVVKEMTVAQLVLMEVRKILFLVAVVIR